MKVIVAIPARNSEKTLEDTFNDIPIKYRKHVIVSDDASTDSTREIAKKLGMKVSKNTREPGYGSNLKNCFKSALKDGADIVVILHSDNQYDATKIPALVRLIEDGKADFTIGSRMIGDKAKSMSKFRFSGNRILTIIENLILGTKLTDLHSGLVAIKADIIRRIPYELDYDDYSLHSEIVIQSHYAGARFAEIGIPTRYEEGNQSISITKSIIYGVRTLIILIRYILHKYKIKKYPQFAIKNHK